MANRSRGYIHRSDQGTLLVFARTHLGCVVYFQPGTEELECPCHEGFFDAESGDVFSGPPQRPLGRIDVEVRNGTVWALAYRGEGDHQ